MSEKILSPDGKFMWTGEKWIPLPDENSLQISDSVIQGDISQETNINVNYKDSKKAISNFVDLAIDKIKREDFRGAEKAFESAKELDVKMALELFEGTRASEITSQYLIYIWKKVEDSVRIVSGFSEENMESINIMIDNSDYVTPILLGEINRLKSAKENISLEIEEEFPDLDQNVLNQAFETLDSTGDETEFSTITTDLEDLDALKSIREIDDCLMQLKGLASIFSECCTISYNKSAAQIGNVESLSERLKALDISSELEVATAYIYTTVQESSEIIELRKGLPDADETTKKFRERALQNELVNLKKKLREVENLTFSITPMMYGQVLTSGEVEILFKYQEIRADLTSIIVHTESRNWDLIKYENIFSEVFGGDEVKLWMGSEDEIREYINEQQISKQPLDEHEMTEMKTLIEALYQVGNTTGKLVNLLAPAWGGVSSIGGKYYYELTGSLGTVSSIIRSTRFAVTKIVTREDWDQIHEGFPKPLIKEGSKEHTVHSRAEELKKANSECFIATAAYGTPYDSKIDVLRNWRDDSLREFYIGRKFIKIYYSLSPPIANIVSKSKILRALVRVILSPIIHILTPKFNRPRVNKF